MPNSTINQLDIKSIEKKFNLIDDQKFKGSIYDDDISYKVSKSQFGNENSLDISFETRNYKDPKERPNLKLFFNILNFVGETLLIHNEDILNYYSEYHDKDAVKSGINNY